MTISCGWIRIWRWNLHVVCFHLDLESIQPSACTLRCVSQLAGSRLKYTRSKEVRLLKEQEGCRRTVSILLWFSLQNITFSSISIFSGVSATRDSSMCCVSGVGDARWWRPVLHSYLSVGFTAPIIFFFLLSYFFLSCPRLQVKGQREQRVSTCYPPSQPWLL